MDSFDQQWQRWFPANGSSRPQSSQAPRRWAFSTVLLAIAGAIALLIILNTAKGWYTEWLWFSSLSHGSVFTTILKTKILIFFTAAVIFFVLFFGNLVLAAQLTPKTDSHFWPWAIVGPLQRTLKISVILGTLLLSLIFGLAAQGNWEVVLQFFNWQPFGITDPAFHRELGFYIFSLPFLHFVRGWFLGALIITLLGSAAVYLLSYTVQRLRFDRALSVLAHIGGLFIFILGLFAWGYWLGIWELVFSGRGVVFGASYTDMHAQVPAQWILLSVVVLLAGVVAISIWQRNFRLILYGIGGWTVAAIIIGGIFPALIQRFQVEPSELVREGPYIEYNIQFTREAFGLNRIEEESFPAEDMPNIQDIVQNETTLSNIRLWDPRPLKDTYNQIQSFRPYYDFNDVDVDRYIIDNEYRQAMLSARELTAEKLPSEAQTWINRRLQFTHGYGIALNTVTEVSTEGLPVLRMQDIPPAGDLEIARPEIYFGEKTNEYVVVNTKTQEFDFPMGDENVYGHYQGRDGVGLGNFARRLLYAWQFGDLNILISGELSSESRILYYRNIQERVNHLAPFLNLDNDPYVALIEGKLFWIQDAYTTTNRYPYSEPVAGEFNYVRNSVKAVIDAYNGNVTFYVTEPDDALIRTYQAIFPELFTSFEQMPESLRAHIRYPEDMFNIQASVYQRYHMRDIRVFYNKEDQWAVPREYYAGKEQPMESYYIIMRLPGEEKEEFLLMLPFTPVNKNNTIGWLAARSDGGNYGKLLAYLFPKERLVYGPSQIENRIQQDTVITEQFALWGRGGSRVLRGNLLLIPIGTSKIYVEPVFLQAESGGLPELKRVIVAAGDRIAMEPTLETSLMAIFGDETSLPKPIEESPLVKPEKPITTDVAELVEEAQQHYDNAQQFLKDGNWTGYGTELDALREVLRRLTELTSVLTE